MRTTTLAGSRAYSWIEYETMFAVRCVGKDDTADIHTPKTVANILHIVNQYHTTYPSNEPYTRKQVVAMLDELTARAVVLKVGDCYKASPHVVSRNISGLVAGKPDDRIMAIVELFGESKTIHGIPVGLDLTWQFMIQPNLCDEYNDAVEAVLAEDFNKLLVQSEGNDESLRRAIKAYKEINVPYTPTLRGSVGV
jgi:hypothetical protein